MERLKKVAKILLFPPVFLVILFAILAAAGLIYAFAYSGAHPFAVYFCYFFSAYALTVACVRAPAIYRYFKTFKQENKYIRRYTSDAELRVKISLYSSVAMNVIYAALQLVLGIMNHSIWFYSLAGYYLLLTLMRYFLLKEVRKQRVGKDRFFELLLYRFSGVLLLVMNLALAVVVFYIVWENRGFEHHYIVTIAMAAYTFLTLTLAIINIVKYRKYKSPVMSATKAISLVASLVSMLSLETAMLTAFGEENQALFRRIMTACSGSAVCIAVLVIAVYMIVRSTKEIRMIKGEQRNAEQ